MRLDEATYSRLVAWLQVILPLLALVILSTLFLVARTVDPAQELRYSTVDIDKLAREQRIGKPKFNGVTDTGAAVSISAETASPDPSDPTHVTGQIVAAEIALPSGEQIAIQAAEMDVDYSAGLATLLDGVRVTSDSGYTITTEKLDVSFRETRIYSDQTTRITGTVGEITAGAFELTSKPGVENSYVLIFKNGVKMLYNRGVEAEP